MVDFCWGEKNRGKYFGETERKMRLGYEVGEGSSGWLTGMSHFYGKSKAPTVLVQIRQHLIMK